MKKAQALEDALRVCIQQNNYFLFEGNYYRQKHGLSMGCNLAGLLAGITLDHHLHQIIRKLPFSIFFLKKYVDDILFIIDKRFLHLPLEIFNSDHSTLQFTLEDDERLPYLST